MNYWQRWIGDWRRKTAHLSACEKGIYGELLDHCYALDTPILPADLRAVCRIAGAHGKAEFAAVERVVSEFFERTDGGFVNPRAAEEIKKRSEYVGKQRELAMRRWDAEQTPAATQTNDKPKPNGSLGFPEFWLAYPRHESKAKAEKAWHAITPDDSLRARIMQAVIAQREQGCLRQNFDKNGRSTIPHASSWLNGKRWEDELQAERTNDPRPRNADGSLKVAL